MKDKNRDKNQKINDNRNTKKNTNMNKNKNKNIVNLPVWWVCVCTASNKKQIRGPISRNPNL